VLQEKPDHVFPADIPMTVAIAPSPTAPHFGPRTPASAVKIARIEVFESMARVESIWRRLENGPVLTCGYQRFDLLSRWQEHVGTRIGITPFVVAAFDQPGEPLFLWPFGLQRIASLRVVRFLGSKHANFNVGLWRREIISVLAREDIERVCHELKPDVDLMALCNQPLSWAGAGNPFLLLPHQPSVDMSAQLELRRLGRRPLERILSSSTRSRLRNKERKLRKLGGYRYIQAETAKDIDRLLDQFFALKAAHLAAQGLGNVFAEPGVAEFLRRSCHCRLENGRPLIEIHALESADEVLALFGTIVDEYRCSSMFNTYTLGDSARNSPGLILLGHMVTACAGRGIQSFDIGVGRAPYKSFFCPEREPLFDSFVPLTSLGRVGAAAFTAAFAAKRAIKQSRPLWTTVQMARRLRSFSRFVQRPPRALPE
jgi:CelD/BcsL family acetyltransferase involved in cellulose biosynthesis